MDLSSLRAAIEVVLMAASPAALAADGGAAPGADAAARTAVRATGRLTGFSLQGLGVEVSERFLPVLGVDLSLTEEDFGNNRAGIGGEAFVRLYSGEGRHLLTLGVGPAVRDAPEYGPIAFGAGEVAYEYLPIKGPSVLVGAGADVVLNDSGTATCGGNGWFSCGLFWQSHYHQGETQLRLRIAVGGSF